MMSKEFIVEHPCGILISRELKESEMSSVNDAEKQDMKTGYVWYSLPATQVLGKNVAFSLCFFNGILTSISLALSNPNLYGSGWDNWSEKKERLRSKHTGEWLETNGYRLGSHPWGKVWATYDAKGASGGGGVQYNP